MVATRLAALVALLVALLAALPAQVRLPRIFTDHMVLQQRQPIVVWGTATPGEAVHVRIAGADARCTADHEGRWRVELPPRAADGTRHRLEVDGSNSIALDDVVFGEVWLCAGQSNMNREARVQDEHPDIRLFWIDGSVVPQRDDLGQEVAGWVPATPAAVAGAAPALRQGKAHERDGFAEVGYVFGRRVHAELKVPVGLIKCAFGGSQVRAWIPDPTLPDRVPFGTAATGGYLGHRPGLLYQSMVHGIVPFGLRGVLWYQGENNGRDHDYHLGLTQWIASWRRLWGRPGLPFYMVQIAPTTYAGGRMQHIWEAQEYVMHTVPHVGLAVSNDIYLHGKAPLGDVVGPDGKLTGKMRPSNPHPPNKHVVGERLADIALVETYRRADRVRFGPMYAGHEVRGAVVRVRFRYVGAGLRTRDGGAPTWFELSDGTREKKQLRFHAAEAKIVAPDTVEVRADAVPAPRSVRFGWDCIAVHNLQNSAGLPAVAFRTDDALRDAAPLRFVTYNIHGGGPVAPTDAAEAALRTLRGDHPMHAVLARELSGLRADVIALQEAKSRAFVEKLAAAMGVEHAYFPGGWRDPDKGWPEGIPCAILSRHPVVASADCPLANHAARPGDLFTRGYGKVVVRTHHGEVAVFVAHLLPSWKNTTHIREREIAEIAAATAVERAAGRSVVVLGDMNLAPSAPEYALWGRHGFVDCVASKGGGPQPTCPTTAPKERIDYVFALGPIAARLQAARALRYGVWSIDGRDAASFALSDHLPVEAVFEPPR